MRNTKTKEQEFEALIKSLEFLKLQINGTRNYVTETNKIIEDIEKKATKLQSKIDTIMLLDKKVSSLEDKIEMMIRVTGNENIKTERQFHNLSKQIKKLKESLNATK